MGIQTAKSINTNGMTTEQWIDSRRRGIGGSDVAAALGYSKWKTPLQLYLEKIGEFKDDFNSDAAYWGTTLEEIVAKEFAKRAEKKVHRVNKIIIHPEHDFLIANLDRRVVGENAILECKTTSAYNYKEWESDEVPTAYLLQVMHYLNVTGAEKAYIAVLIGGQRFMWKEIPRDEELIQMVQKKLVDFWMNHVVPEIPPKAGAQDGELLNKLYPAATSDDAIALPSEVDTAIVEINDLTTTIKELETQKKTRENRIKELLGESSSGYTHSWLINWKNITSNRLDSKKLKKEHPEIVEEYSKESSYRRFSVKEVKTA